MKTVLLFALFLLVGRSFAQVMVENKANVFTLLVDYNSPQFEGGNLAYYDCVDCSNDSLPFMIDYHDPGDFGSISYMLPTGDTLFYGSMAWMGQGEMFYPSAFSTESPFMLQDDIVAMPEDVVCYDMQGRRISDPQFMNAAQTAWYEVNRLEVVKMASENGFKTAMMVYAPTVGVFDPGAAKWVIFMYRNVQSTSVEETAAFTPFYTVYPNPAKSVLNVSQGLAKVSHYEVRNNLGQVLQKGDLDSHSILLTGMTDGIYFLDLRDGDNLVQRIRFQKF